MSIQNARSNTSGNAPSSLKDGQIAISQADGIIFSRNVDGTIRRLLLPKRRGMADAAFTVLPSDTYIGIASLTASRTITLPPAASYPAGQPLTIADESGAVTASITVGLAQASGSSDTINGATNLLFTTPYFGATLFSDGVSKWAAIGLAAGGTGSALLYTPQTLTAAQQRQTLANLALSATNMWMTEIQAAASKGSYFGLLDGIADGFTDNSGIDTANATNVNVISGTVINQASDPTTNALLHFDGANNSTTITDDVAGNTWTANGGAKLSTSNAVFGTGSLLVSSGSDYVSATIPVTINANGDFTAEIRIRPTAANGNIVFNIANGGSSIYAIAINSTPKFTVLNTAGTVIITSGTTVTLNTYYALALCRSNGTLRLFVNGTLDGSSAASTAFGSSTTISIGGTSGNYDEFRFSNIARYTASFTPATSAFVAGTSGVLTLPSINYALQSVPLKGSIRIRAKATADVISPNTNFIASLSRNGTLGGSNSLDVTLAQTAVLPDGYAHYEANEVDLTGLTSGSVLKGSLRTVGTSLGVAIDGWRIRAA